MTLKRIPKQSSNSTPERNDCVGAPRCAMATSVRSFPRIRACVVFVVTMVAIFSTSRPCEAQLPIPDQTTTQGFTPFGSYDHGDVDSVSVVDRRLQLHIPIASYPQRGNRLKFDISVTYTPVHFVANDPYRYQVQPRIVMFGGPEITYSTDLIYDGVNVNTPDGGQHPVITMSGTNFNQITTDLTGYRASGTTGGITDSQGVSSQASYGYSRLFTDPNGNQLVANPGPPRILKGFGQLQAAGTSTPDVSVASWTDSIGRTIPVAGNGALGNRNVDYTSGEWNIVNTSNGTQSSAQFLPVTDSAHELQLTNHAGWTLTDSSGCTGTLPTQEAYAWQLPGIGGTDGTVTYKVCYALIYVNQPYACSAYSQWYANNYSNRAG